MNGRMNCNRNMNVNSNNGENCRSRQALFAAIEAISFTLDELRLYLDTHPYCRNALEMYGEYEKRRHELVAEYTDSSGPISAYYVDVDSGWSWDDEPLPWKAEAN